MRETYTETVCPEPDASVREPDCVAVEGAAACFHCGTPCPDGKWRSETKSFCCGGCLAVYELLAENGLADFYRLDGAAGVRVSQPVAPGRFAYLDDEAVRRRLVDFEDDRITRVTFRIPAIYCAACIWLLENLFRLCPGIGPARVHFSRKEVSIEFENRALKLSQVAEFLSSIGYEPELRFSDLREKPAAFERRRLWLRVGVAGFAFGNIMLFSIALYAGLDAFSGPRFETLFGFMSMILAVPVIVYSGSGYWRAVWIAVRRRILTMDVPVAIGIAAIAGRSGYEILSGTGHGYFDSLTGLVFFLLCGRLFQQKTYDRLSFDRDYTSFFPLSARRRDGAEETAVALSELKVGDRLVIRHGELIPADGRLIGGAACIDYSFVTGESVPVEENAGDYLFAGGRQMGGAIEVETVKPVAQSYLTSLWNQDAFRKGRRGEADGSANCDSGESFNSLTNRFARLFTPAILGVATAAALFWWIQDPSRVLNAFTAVLIVACPCALALAAPFTLGTAQRLLAERRIYLKHPDCIETLARVDAVVFDKTGTLTGAEAGEIRFEGAPLTGDEERWIRSMTRHSIHPAAVRIGKTLDDRRDPGNVASFLETPGQGMEGRVAGTAVWMGSARWLGARGVSVPENGNGLSSAVHVAFNGVYRGAYTLQTSLRPGAGALVADLAKTCELALLSGDRPGDSARFRDLFGAAASVRFDQSPLDKMEFIKGLHQSGRTVAMVGDGLNDAGALRQSDIGLAVTENAAAFSPASDVILEASRVGRLADLLDFSKRAIRVVRWSIVISLLYNVVGVGIAAAGLLSPVVCAILMPLSSVTVVGFGCGGAAWAGRRSGIAADPATANTAARRRVEPGMTATHRETEEGVKS